ncbi:hypothetical protein [Escherichia coli]|uniref:hypothetical protein n=1 Tax=Escherichia coli TaxID=562 RepID=UPI0002CC3AA4|nr:hypothetical protein [Escherichia coli]EAA2746865.1 hypothetical protein [Escherichia coli]EGD5120850.1 hypothetical protein [Escherichia coli]EHW7647174.1 hypothetical protein [Escherichia coli]EJL7925861.1 hypothetical protein [Escherichia coli]EKB0066402.1 hypothetical protein [Escherichia coli]
MKKLFFAFPLVISSFSTFAGGGSEWQPTVSPGQCIEYTEIGETGGYKWNDTDSCNEVVRRGYASGVMVSGKVFYDGAPSISYTGHVAPNKPYARQAPLYNDGKKKWGHGDSYTYWAR